VAPPRSRQPTPRVRIEIPVLIRGEDVAQLCEISISGTPSAASPGDDLEPALSHCFTNGALRGDHVRVRRSEERADRESIAVAQDREAGSVRDRRADINDQTLWPKDPPCAPEGIDHALARNSAEGP
jgi:hypothetical protein